MLNDENSIKYREFVLDGIHMAEFRSARRSKHSPIWTR